MVVLDGREVLGLLPGTALVNLRQLHPGVGEHELGVGGQRATFQLVGDIHEQPAASGYGHLIDRTGDTGLIGVFVADAPPDGVVRGALVLDGRPATVVTLARTLGSTETFVLAETGRCVQVDVRPPPWLTHLDLPVRYVEVSTAVRGIYGRPAFFAHRLGPGRPLHLTEITQPPPSGASRILAERPDVAADLLRQLVDDHVPPADALDARRLRAVVQAMERRYADGRTLAGKPGPRYPGRPPPASRNPRIQHATRYDDILSWISELESGTVAVRRLRDTWGWLCHRDERPADADRSLLVAYQLEVLGHLEQDRDRHRVGAAPAVANVLAGGGGYAVLSGSRPPRLLKRLDEPFLDPDPRVRLAGQHWDLHRRDQRDDNGEPVGPTAMYLEWDPDHAHEVRAGLRAIGVQVVARAGDQLLDLLAPLPDTLAVAVALSMSPSARFDQWVPSADGHRWLLRHDDRGPGLYRYPSLGAPIFCWRETSGGALRIVDKRVGFYLQHDHDGRRHLLQHDPFESRLLVPRTAPLPPLIARALVLRTGLLPWLLPDMRPNAAGAPRQVLVYRNVDDVTAERIGRLLGQSVDSLTRRLEDCR